MFSRKIRLVAIPWQILYVLPPYFLITVQGNNNEVAVPFTQSKKFVSYGVRI